MELAELENDTRVSVKTANEKLSNISLWFKWAKENLYIDQNLFQGVNVKVDKRQEAENARTVYTPEQLNLIFSSTLYTGMLSKSRWYEPGNRVIKDLRYWAPLIGVHTGMRIEEMPAQAF